MVESLGDLVAMPLGLVDQSGAQGMGAEMGLCVKASG